jgi:hypothetical protein
MNHKMENSNLITYARETFANVGASSAIAISRSIALPRSSAALIGAE